MADTFDIEEAFAPHPEGTLLQRLERRRAGRVEQISPHLIPLLRNPVPEGEAARLLREEAPFDAPLEAELRADANALAPVKGIIAAALISIPIWALFLVAVSYFL